jgi:hypothetical protein
MKTKNKLRTYIYNKFQVVHIYTLKNKSNITLYMF